MIKYRRVIFSIAAFGWMAVIFLFSAQPAGQSGLLSGYIWQQVIRFFTTLLGHDAGAALCSVILNEHFIRKCGHFFEYLVLGILYYETADSFGLKRKIPYSILFSVLYAAADEIHQVFIPGRGPAVSDVLLDSIAAVTGIIVVNMLSCRIKRGLITTQN